MQNDNIRYDTICIYLYSAVLNGLLIAEFKFANHYTMFSMSGLCWYFYWIC